MDRNTIFGGNPLSVIIRLVVLSIIVGIIMSALNIRPEDLIYNIRRLIDRLSFLGLDIFRGAFGYFLLGAAVVIPVWLVTRIFGAAGSRGDRRE